MLQSHFCVDFCPLMPQILLFNKPFNVLSQFTDGQGRDNLSHYVSVNGFYPAGRLDRDSEGLLALTDDGRLQDRIASPVHKLPKTYWAQVEGEPDDQALAQLRKGVELNDGLTAHASARIIVQPNLWTRDPPIRYRRDQPTSWLELVLHEGRNRQVRRMTAAVGHPTLRLIRVQIGPWGLGDLQPGEYRFESIHLPHPKPTAGRTRVRSTHTPHHSRGNKK